VNVHIKCEKTTTCGNGGLANQMKSKFSENEVQRNSPALSSGWDNGRKSTLDR
jgi:hypothetical protein